MAMLASKSPYPAPLGGGSHVAQYQQGSSYRLPAASANQAYHPSPTESEFSESYEISDSVRYVEVKQLTRLPMLMLVRAEVGTKPESQTGCVVSTVLNMLTSSEVSLAQPIDTTTTYLHCK